MGVVLVPWCVSTKSLSEVDLWQWRRGAVEGATIPTGMVPVGTFSTICWTQCRDGCASDNWAWKSCETVCGDVLWEEVDGSLDMVVVEDVWRRAAGGKVQRGVGRDWFRQAAEGDSAPDEGGRGRHPGGRPSQEREAVGGKVGGRNAKRSGK